LTKHTIVNSHHHTTVASMAPVIALAPNLIL
jgi:hypothetical protein